MNSTSFESTPAERLQLGTPTALVNSKVASLGDSPVILATTRRLVIWNKNPTTLTVLLRRRGVKNSVDVGFEVKRVFTDAAAMMDHFFIATGAKGEVAVVRCDISEEVKPVVEASVKADAEVLAASLGGAKGQVFTYDANGRVVRFSGADLATKTELRGPNKAVAPLLVVSGDTIIVGQNNAVDVLSATTKKSVLAATWAPHTDGTAFAYVFTRFSPTGVPLVLTYAKGSDEVRLWSSVADGKPVLLSQCLLTIPDTASRQIFVSDLEEHVVVALDKALVVLTTAEGQPAMVRATEFQTEGAFKAIALSSDTTSKGDNVVRVVMRDDTQIMNVILPSLINGAPNLSGATKAAAATPAATPASAAAVAEPSKRPAAAIVSSSIRGTTAQVDPSQVEGAIVALVGDLVPRALNDSAASVQGLNQLGGFLKNAFATAQTPEVQQLAESVGVNFAKRNAARIAGAVAVATPVVVAAAPAAVAPVAPAAAGVDDVHVRALLKLPERVQNSVFKQIVQVADKAVVSVVSDYARHQARQQSVEVDIPMPKISSTTTLTNFQLVTDKVIKAQNTILKDAATRGTELMEMVSDETVAKGKQSLGRARGFMDELKKELRALSADIDEAHTAVVAAASVAAPSPAAALSQKKPVEQALELVKNKQYSAAVVAVTEAKDIHALCEFLEAEEVASDFSTVFAPGAISDAAFSALCGQLAHALDEQPTLMGKRLKWLSELLLDWHDHLETSAASSLRVLLVKLEEVRAAVDEATKLRKGDLSQESKRHGRNVVKAILALQKKE